MPKHDAGAPRQPTHMDAAESEQLYKLLSKFKFAWDKQGPGDFEDHVKFGVVELAKELVKRYAQTNGLACLWHIQRYQWTPKAPDGSLFKDLAIEALATLPSTADNIWLEKLLDEET